MFAIRVQISSHSIGSEILLAIQQSYKTHIPDFKARFHIISNDLCDAPSTTETDLVQRLPYQDDWL